MSNTNSNPGGANPGAALHVTINPERCVGFGRCAAVAPGLYFIDEETGKAYYEAEDLANAQPKDVFAGARACPTQAIIVEQFGRRIFPQIITPMPADIQRQLQEAAEDDERDPQRERR